ncbi:MAG TPA: glutaredoxin family protein [Gemmatimonadales bacterium]|nr:glutaredoxin family protein [Gemmatimonadales bacterium]
MWYAEALPPFGGATPALDVPVVVYGTRWCAATQIIRRHLERLGVPYRYVDLEADPTATARLRWLTGGSASHPTVSIGGELLVEPTLGELEWALARNGLR